MIWKCTHILKPPETTLKGSMNNKSLFRKLKTTPPIRGIMEMITQYHPQLIKFPHNEVLYNRNFLINRHSANCPQIHNSAAVNVVATTNGKKIAVKLRNSKDTPLSQITCWTRSQAFKTWNVRSLTLLCHIMPQ